MVDDALLPPPAVRVPHDLAESSAHDGGVGTSKCGKESCYVCDKHINSNGPTIVGDSVSRDSRYGGGSNRGLTRELEELRAGSLLKGQLVVMFQWGYVAPLPSWAHLLPKMDLAVPAVKLN